MAGSVLKLGLFVEKNIVPTWLYHALDKLVGDGHISIKLIVTVPKQEVKNSNHLFNLYQSLDTTLFKLPHDGLKTKSLDKLTNSVTTISSVDEVFIK